MDTGLRKRTTASTAAARAAADAASEPLLRDDEDRIHPQMSPTCPGIPTMPRGSIIVALIITVVALWTRLYKISLSPFVVWDEAHFGKFAGYYIKRQFYFDVHPPLGKMLNGLAGLIAGFNGSFEFESGARYPPELRYSVMRFFNGLFGALMAPLAYYTGIHLHMSQAGAILVATLVIVDNAFCVISRFILLDSMLLFFTTLSVYCLVVFRNYQKTDVKWVGLFAVALVGLHTIDDLWDMLGNLKMPAKTYINHWIFRIAYLIITPLSIYVACFALHFGILNRSGPGDAQMSSLFQASLAGSDFKSNPLELAYGSKVSLKNNARGGGLLHSHVQRYPSGSEQQQVTCYHHKDSNNEFIIMPAWDQPLEFENTKFVEHGDVVRLVHAQTQKNIHSHRVAAPLTAADYEVSGYGNATFGDANDLWVIEKVDDWTVSKDVKRIRSLTTRFRLRHKSIGCLLRSDGVTLPQWGFKQVEVVCQKKPDDNSPSNMWNIELHVNERLPPGNANTYRSSFIRDFFDLNVAMWTSNNALTPDPDKEPDQLVSQPYHWPFLIRTLRMCGWGDHEIKYLLIGNPTVWWGSTASLALVVSLFLGYVVRWRRGIRDFTTLAEWDNFYMAAKVSVLGWFLHYFPFYIMGRVMYLHHYFPALYFAVLAFGFVVDHIARKLPSVLHIALVALVAAVAIANFLFFADFSFGMSGPASAYANRRWLKTWNIYS
nr:Protein O-mannosyltransferase 2 [Polyrhizophydium stewartii]